MKLHWIRPQGLMARSVALGTFDGVHLGHQKLIETAVNQRPKQGCSSIFTFDYPPEQIFTGRVQLLSAFEQRQKLLFQQGIDEVVWSPFTKEMAKEPPEQFIRNTLIRALRVSHVVCGFNFRFGHQASGTPQLLKEYGQKHGFSVEIVDPIVIDGQPVSSTRIRRCLVSGQIAEAAQLLGRYQSYSGHVAHGQARGRRLGFPTANLEIDKDLVLPADGVYVTWCILGPETGYPAVTAVGSNPTFDGKERTIESYLLGFTGDLYGHELEIQFLHRLRAMTRYESADALRRQIAADVQAAEHQMTQLRLQNGRIVLK